LSEWQAAQEELRVKQNQAIRQNMLEFDTVRGLNRIPTLMVCTLVGYCLGIVWILFLFLFGDMFSDMFVHLICRPQLQSLGVEDPAQGRVAELEDRLEQERLEAEKRLHEQRKVRQRLEPSAPTLSFSFVQVQLSLSLSPIWVR
jgi:hypothetical protein